MTDKPETTTVKVCIMVDCDGNSVVTDSPDELTDAWNDRIGDVPMAVTSYSMAVRVPLPAALVELEGSIPAGAEPGAEITLTLKD